jgi:hypothetical protein
VTSREALRNDPDRAFTGYNPEVTEVERQNRSQVAFRTGNDRRIGKSQWEIGVTAHKLADSAEVGLTAVKAKCAIFDVGQQR